VTILSTRNPGFTSSTFIKLRPSNPAPTTRTKVIAICAATIALANALAALRNPLVPARLPPDPCAGLRMSSARR